MNLISIDPATTALVAIDLQHSNVARQLAPHGSAQVVSRNVELADSLRASGGTVIWVRVDVAALPVVSADRPLGRAPDAPPLPSNATELVDELNRQPADLVVTKRNWGAFYGTDLDLRLRRRGIRTILLTGIATNFGVESTARNAFDLGLEIVFVEDAMSSISDDMHRFSTQSVFPHIGRVRTTAEVIGAIAAAARKTPEIPR